LGESYNGTYKLVDLFVIVKSTNRWNLPGALCNHLDCGSPCANTIVVRPFLIQTKASDEEPKGVDILPPSPPRDTLEVVSFRWGVTEIRSSKVQGTQSLDRFGLPRA
jgi:hypothetical protein